MQNALLRACAMSHAKWAAAPAAPPSIAQSGRCAHATPTTERERERERDVALPTVHSLRVHWTHLLRSFRVSLSRFPRAFSLFLLIAVSCVVFLCLFLLHLHHFAVLALLFRSQLVAIVPLSSSRLDSMRPSFRYGFQFRPEAPAQSSRTYAKLWFHLTNGQAINHKIKKHKFWQIESDDDCPTEVFEPG